MSTDPGGMASGPAGASPGSPGEQPSFRRRLLDGLRTLDFGNRIVVFGASMLLSVVPLIVLLSSFAGHRVDVDLSRHLALSPQGAHLMASLFAAAPARVNLAVLVSLALAVAGAIAVARSVQTGYEQVFRIPGARGARNLARCGLWIALTGGLLIADGFVAPHVGDRVWAVAAYRAVELVVLFGYFLGSMWLLLGGRVSWLRLAPPAVITSLMWIGLRGVAALYFSPSLVSDGRTYGTVGVVLTLLTWFIAIDAVVLLGAVVGVALDRPHRRDLPRTHTPDE